MIRVPELHGSRHTHDNDQTRSQISCSAVWLRASSFERRAFERRDRGTHGSESAERLACRRERDKAELTDQQRADRGAAVVRDAPRVRTRLRDAAHDRSAVNCGYSGLFKSSIAARATASCFKACVTSALQSCDLVVPSDAAAVSSVRCMALDARKAMTSPCSMGRAMATLLSCG